MAKKVAKHTIARAAQTASRVAVKVKSPTTAVKPAPARPAPVRLNGKPVVDPARSNGVKANGAKAPLAKPTAARPAVLKSPIAKQVAVKPASSKAVVTKPSVVKAPVGNPPVAKPSASTRPGARVAGGSKVAAPAKPVAIKSPTAAPALVAKAPPTKSALKAAAAAARRARREAREKEPPKPLVPLPPPPVTTDSKPKKNLAGLSTKELDHFRAMLLAKRRELLGDMSSMEREALQSGHGSNLSNLPVHMADMGTDNYEQEFTLGLVEKDRQLLREINQALAKILDGSYGICEGTGKPINKMRLEIQPWAKFSVEYARTLEKNMMLRR